jgi:hypothetical protein
MVPINIFNEKFNKDGWKIIKRDSLLILQAYKKHLGCWVDVLKYPELSNDLTPQAFILHILRNVNY